MRMKNKECCFICSCQPGGDVEWRKKEKKGESVRKRRRKIRKGTNTRREAEEESEVTLASFFLSFFLK